ncbi:MAG: carboxylating nicotinate-nucleotide diphosphorylase [Woeseiaceae bacterium]
MNVSIREDVARALAEDVGDGDLTAGLIPASSDAVAEVKTRDAMILAGRAWVDEVMHQVDLQISVDWLQQDGDELAAGTQLFSVRGPARSILTAERTALNFLQMLSATATATAKYVAAVAGTGCKILDTRKTIPGLRLAQKYAVRCGGGVNHRIGLFDAILIKENHIASAGGVAAAIDHARNLHAEMPVEIEVESLAELRDALGARAERMLLDNFSMQMLRDAVAINRDEGDPPAELEASGGVTLEQVSAIAATGVDYISVGAITKNVQAIDLSMRFTTGGVT